MTSGQTMLLGLALCSSVVMTLGCQSAGPELTAPGVHTAPYDTRQGEVLWAIAPLANESGTTAVDALAITDAVAGAAEQIRGVRCLPVNRTIQAMRTLGLQEIRTEAEARALAQALGAEGILVGTITAWDPYEPPVLGLTLALFPSFVPTAEAVDPRGLSRASSDLGTPTNPGAAPNVVVSEHLDARTHDVQLRLRQFAEGRSESGSALGWRVYLASMDLYTHFAAHELLGGLLEEEWLRLARESTRQALGQDP